METLKIGKSNLNSSRLIYGCMRLYDGNSETAGKKGKTAINTALEEGFNHFDHADIYGAGKSEELFSEVLKEAPGLREKLLITSKCGIRIKGQPAITDVQRYDFSRNHIVKSVEGILKRLNTDYLDILLLHRPDFLCDPAVVAEVFQELKDSGKVLNFGVSNFSPSQTSMLQAYCPMPLITNQVEINIHNVDALYNGTLDQCLEQKMTPQAWCPLGGVVYPAWGNTFSKDDELRIKKEFDLQARKYETENWIIMLAWLLMHPSKIAPIIGTTNPARIKEAKKALDISYTREDWYRLLEARNGEQVP